MHRSVREMDGKRKPAPKRGQHGARHLHHPKGADIALARRIDENVEGIELRGNLRRKDGDAGF